jgi:glycosyltransferase involved in cell wall biosynthesis
MRLGMSEQRSVGIIVPSWQEEETIGPLLEALQDVAPEARVLVVDDSPDDRTVDAARATGHPGLRIIHREGKGGRGTAVLDGMRLLLDEGCTLVVEMDADLSHPPEQIPELLEAARREDLDLVIASRYLPGGRVVNWPLSRRLLSRTANLVARGVLRVPVSDCTTGFRVYSRSACEAILTHCGNRVSGFIGLSESLVAVHYSGLRIGEVPSVFTNRSAGGSAMGLGEIWGGLVGLARIRGLARELQRS